jgi:hypothetical protein
MTKISERTNPAILLSVAFQRSPWGYLTNYDVRKTRLWRKSKNKQRPQPTDPTNAPPPPGKRIKGYTSEGKPVYE